MLIKKSAIEGVRFDSRDIEEINMNKETIIKKTENFTETLLNRAKTSFQMREER